MERRARKRRTKPRTKRKPQRGLVTFMRYLKYWRLVRGLTQKQAAKKVGVEQGTYCDYENGHKKPHPKHYEGLHEMTGRPVEEIVSKIHKVTAEEMGGMTVAASAK